MNNKPQNDSIIILQSDVIISTEQLNGYIIDSSYCAFRCRKGLEVGRVYKESLIVKELYPETKLSWTM